MEAKLYYTAPSDEIFEEVKKEAKRIWSFYDNTYGYVTEKISEIDHLENIKDNVMYIIAKFDNSNQRKLSTHLSEEAKLAIRERMIDGGTPIQFIVF